MSEPQQRGTQRNTAGPSQRRANTTAVSTRAATPAAPTRAPTPDVGFTLPEFVWPTLPDTGMHVTRVMENYTQWPTAWGEAERLSFKHQYNELAHQISANLWGSFRAYIAEVDQGYRNKIEILENEAQESKQQHESLVEEVNLLTSDMKDMRKEYIRAIEEIQNDTTVMANKLLTQLKDQNNSRKDDILRLQKQLDALPAGGIDHGMGRSKMPDPPTFSGSESKQDIRDWIRNIKLYTKHTGIIAEGQQIVFALGRLRSPATKYFVSYFDAVEQDKDLGSWATFAKMLTDIYGQKDELESAKKEFSALWSNKTLAHKDFIKYSEQFKTLGSLVDYEDKLLIDKLKEVAPTETHKTVTVFGLIHGVPTKWQEYLDLLLKVHKELDRDSSTKRIFGKEEKSSSDNKGKSSWPAVTMDSSTFLILRLEHL